jgi:hypothetical protein
VRLRRPPQLLAATAAALLCAAAMIGACGGGADAGVTITVAAPPPGAPPLRIGLVANTLDARGLRAAEQRTIRGLGVRWVREELRWGSVEPAPGVYRWRHFDRLLADAARRDLNVLPLLLGTPRWAGSAPLALARDPRAFGAFAARAAARYGPGGTFWAARPELDARLAPRWFEVWNEPYTERYSTGGVDPARYARMVRAAIELGRTANPRVGWLMAGELVYEDAGGVPHDWLAAIDAVDPALDADVAGVAVHPYAFGAPGREDPDLSLRYRFDRLQAVARGLAARGAGGTPLWITELGWSTCALRPDCTSEREQAQRLADVIERLRRKPLSARVRALFVYHLRDFPGRRDDDREAHYGLLRTDGTRKPAWTVVRSAVRQAGTAAATGR